MKVQFLDSRSKVLWQQATYFDWPLMLPSLGSEVKLPNNNRYTVLKCSVDYSKMKNVFDHLKVEAKVILKELPND